MVQTRSKSSQSPMTKEQLTNGNESSKASGSPKVSTKVTADQNFHKYDKSGNFEFGGAWGCAAMIVGFPILMYYMWISSTFYGGKLALPNDWSEDGLKQFAKDIARCMEHAKPNTFSIVTYWGFTIVQAIFYVTLPGVTCYGLPIPSENGRRLKYYCNAYCSLYVTIAIIAFAQYFGYFNLPDILDNFGAILTVGTISSTIIAIIVYFYAIYTDTGIRMTGSPIYDLFMGSVLNPRIGMLDLKMFMEVRVPWYMLFIIGWAGCVKQYQEYGYVSPQMWYCVMASGLMVNACGKGEEMIVPTWDMHHEKWGYLLIFWNCAGVPLTYCQNVLYLSGQNPKVYEWSTPVNVALFVAYLFAYYVWDTCNGQKNRFRQQMAGTEIKRYTFPQLPWQEVKNPTYIKCANGGTLLTSGWYRYARKIHYTSDIVMISLSGLVCGFGAQTPYFYPVFFTIMIIHRTVRDVQKCRKKYGADWDRYTEMVPALFIPYVI